jgi:hypothetical protein
MNKDGWLIHKGKFISWTYETFASKKDLTVHPHFELTITDKENDNALHFNDIQVKDRKLRKQTDLLKLPEKVKNEILDNAVKALEFEYA